MFTRFSYLVDGNALFLSATEIVRRSRPRYEDLPEAVIIAIGYPLTDSLSSPKRQFDLTPPSSVHSPSQAHGGADKFLHFIERVVRPFITSSVFPNVTIKRSALFGHSFGGLFTLHALFTRPSVFDTFLAASPSIWWNERLILNEEAKFGVSDGMGSPCLRLSFGSLEQFPRRHRNQSLEEYEQIVESAAGRRMTDNCRKMYERLTTRGKLHALEMREYADEDHGSVISAALSGGLLWFLDME